MVREVGRSRLVAGDGREIYVEPTVFEPSGRDLLLAGTPNYLWRRRTPGGAVDTAAIDSVFGVVIRPNGRVRVVPSPIDGRLVASVRAVGRDAGVWDVVFAELEKPRSSPADDGTAARYWHGVLDGARWSSLEQIPVSAPGRPQMANPSALVRRGDTLAWVTKLSTGTAEWKAVLYERRNGRWSYEFVPAYFASYVSLARSDSLGLVVAVVGPDPTLPGDENSLFFFARQTRWQQLRRVTPGGEEPIHAPSLRLAPGPGVLSWTALVRRAHRGRWERRAMVGRLEAGNGAIIVLDSSVTYATPAVILRGGTRVWVTEHISVDEGGERELRFVSDSAGLAVVLARVRSPFLGPMAAAARSPSEVVVAGPLADRTPGKPAVVTLLIRARVVCPAGSRRSL